MATDGPVIGIAPTALLPLAWEPGVGRVAEALAAAGGFAVDLGGDPAALAALAGQLDGVVFTGGGDVDPRRYGAAADATVWGVDQERDAVEFALAEAALACGVPALGICRGAQLLNVALGGTLWVDLAARGPGAAGHAPHHAIALRSGGRLAAIQETSTLAVNSFHHQAVRAPGAGLAVEAWAPDGVVEAVAHVDPDRFVLGVQYHPESLWAREPAHRAPFAALIAAARARARAAGPRPAGVAAAIARLRALVAVTEGAAAERAATLAAARADGARRAPRARGPVPPPSGWCTNGHDLLEVGAAILGDGIHYCALCSAPDEAQAPAWRRARDAAHAPVA